MRRGGATKLRSPAATAAPAGLRRLPAARARVVGSWRAPVGADPVIVMNIGFELAVAPGWIAPDVIGRRPLQLRLVEVDDVAALARVVFQQRPRERMIAISDADEAAERHNRVSDAAGLLFDHQVVDRAQVFASMVVDVGAL